MNTSSDIKIERPKIIQALLSGFNTIANKPYLMLLPICLDLFLWFGPAWRVDAYFMPIINSASRLPGVDSPEYTTLLENFQSVWQDLLNNFNLAQTLRTLPIGVPSLMVSKPPFENPLGIPTVFNLETSFQVLGFWILFLLIGFALGNLYFNHLSKQIIESPQENKLKFYLKTLVQVILMPVILLIILMILAIPVGVLITLITLISPSMSQFFILLTGMILIWIIMPLIFTPHGIFLYKQNLIAAMMTSISVVRTSMGQTAWFILISFVMIQGMDFLWRSPSVDNWFLIVGIFGHAFTVSAVLAASFFYFIDATKYAQAVMNEKSKPV